MDYEQFMDQIMPHWEAQDFSGFVDAYDACVDSQGGLGARDDIIHTQMHGLRPLRWNALEQLEDHAALEQDVERFIRAQYDNERAMELLHIILDSQGMSRLLDLIEKYSPVPQRIVQAARCRQAESTGDLGAYLDAVNAFNNIPQSTDNEKELRIIFNDADVRFEEDHITHYEARDVNDTNGYICIRAQSDVGDVDVELPLPGNDSICESGSAILKLSNGAETRLELNRNNSFNFKLFSPYGIKFETEGLEICINNCDLWRNFSA